MEAIPHLSQRNMAAKSKQQKAQPAGLHQPKITEAKICKLATAQSFDRGQQYYHGGAITNPTRQDNRIWADCYGSELYQVSATLTASNVADLRCSCPYDWGGACKHIVALLLTYAHQSEDFHLIPPLRELLVNHSRDNLITLIEQVLQQYPDLLTSLEIAAEVSAPEPAGKAIATSAYRRQIQRALRGDDMDAIAKSLKPALTTAEQLYTAGDRFNAGRFYQVLLAEITDSYDGELQSVDYDGDIACFSQDAAEGLKNCLADSAIDTATRQDWLNTLLDGFLEDVQLGGMDFAFGASEAIIELATDDEWAVLEERIRREISRLKSRWSKDHLATLIAERLQHLGQDAASDEVLLELGSSEQQIFVLLKQGNYDIAISLAKRHFQSYPGLVIQFADALLAAGEAEKALQYMSEEANSNAHHSADEWLAKYHREQGNPKAALKLEEANFLKYPLLRNYQGIQELAEPMGSWPKVRSRLLKQLKQDNHWNLLTEIAIYEQDGAQALKLLKKLPVYQQAPFKLEIAQISEPKVAIALYEELVHSAIELKNRSAYQKAVWHLQSIQKLQKLSKTSKDWKQYIQRIREQYPTLRALHSELARL
jgi:uncharacterized Zn finger protein